jgi:deoxyribonuclease V
MKFEQYHAHRWDVSTQEAIRIQNSLASLVRQEPLAFAPKTIAGVDVSFRRRGYKDYAAQCGIAVLSLPDLTVVDRASWVGDITFPYVPGLLSFREIPAVMEALDRLCVLPDVFMTDGQGLAHPRRFGLACHLGVALDIPTIGVAKKKLIGDFESLARDRGSSTALTHRGELIGAALRTRMHVKPVFVSIGHRITLPEALDLTMVCAPRFKIPEPTRQAHHLSRA